jgi:catechol 2,3-dioxygenase-like lactoylglutathione lyase family enzyme
MRLNHVGICVRDIEKSLASYRDALGLTLFQDELLTGPDVDVSFFMLCSVWS